MRRIDFEAKLRAKAWKDPAFQSRLVADPKGTLQAELAEIEENVALPSDLKVRIVEEDPNEICLVIPRHPAHVAGRAVTDAELEAVAGGTVSTSPTASAVNPVTESTVVLDACSVVTCIDSAVVAGTIV